MLRIAVGDLDRALVHLESAAEKAIAHEIDDGFYALMNLRMNFTDDPLLREDLRFVEVLARIRG